MNPKKKYINIKEAMGKQWGSNGKQWGSNGVKP